MDLADFLAEAGAVVSGGAALGGALGYLSAEMARDFGGVQVDPLRWAENGAQLGAVVGIAALFYRTAGVH